MEKKTGRKRLYEGDEAERHNQAVRKYNARMKEEAQEVGMSMRAYARRGKSQLNVTIDKALHSRLKDEAKRKNKTLSEVVIEKLQK